MNTGPIRPGDLVCVVRGACACIRGHFFRVGSIQPVAGANCATCGLLLLWPVVAFNDERGREVNCCPVEWCQRIPPLDELEADTARDTQPAEVPHV